MCRPASAGIYPGGRCCRLSSRRRPAHFGAAGTVANRLSRAAKSRVMSKSTNPLIGWTVDRSAIKTIGQGLQRPECILAERDGTLWSADARGGVMRIRPDGTQQLVAQTGHRGIDANNPTSFILGGTTLPNGIAINRDGDFLIANFGTDAIELMHRDGNSRPCYTRSDGQPS